MKEQSIQRKIIKYLEQQGAYVVKIITANRSGVPDVIACLNGRFVAVEVKRPGEQPTKLQTYNLECIELAGGLAFEANSTEDVEKKMKN